MDQEFFQVLESMTIGLSTSRDALRSAKLDEQALDANHGISLLALKHHILMSYLQSLTLLAAQRVLGSTLSSRSPPSQPFGSQDRGLRGNHLGDLVDLMIENRLILEKTELLESKMRYQITKLVQIADESGHPKSTLDDPLAFKPDPKSLMPDNQCLPRSHTESRNSDAENEMGEHSVYQPPRLAPVPYLEPSKKSKRQKRALVPSALATLATDPSQPFAETTSGLGGTPALASSRAQYLKRLKDFEEDNFTRIVLKKSEAKRRARDEEDLALGGDLASGTGLRGRRRAGGLEDEFSEVLRSVSRPSGGHIQGDGYEELRKRSKKMAVLERSRIESKKRHASQADSVESSQRQKKRSRFELETKKAKKRLVIAAR